MNKGLATVCLVALVVVGCSDDDDGAVETTSPATVVDTTVAVETTEPVPETTSAPSTTGAAAPTTTTMSEDALKAQIAADYLRSWQLRRELTENPTLDGLDTNLAQITAPGSEDFNNLRDLITQLVTVGERVVRGDPDVTRLDIERIDLLGSPPYQEAVVTICYIRNLARVDATGAVVSQSGIVASRSEDHVVVTPSGWLPDIGFEDLWEGLEVTECPPA